MANIAGDIEARHLENTALFKQITGGDTVRGERKFQDSFSFRPWAVPVFSANKLWRSSDDSEGYYRRWVIIPFPNKLDRTVDFDEGVLHAEASGIFNKAIMNLQVLMQRRYFSQTGAALRTIEEFKLQNDTVAMWLDDEEFVLTQKPNTRMTRLEVITNYSLWCETNNYPPLTSTEVYESLRRKGFQELRSSGARYFLGLRYAPAREQS